MKGFAPSSFGRLLPESFKFSRLRGFLVSQRAGSEDDLALGQRLADLRALLLADRISAEVKVA